jgi:hypothetical protein
MAFGRMLRAALPMSGALLRVSALWVGIAFARAS